MAARCKEIVGDVDRAYDQLAECISSVSVEQREQRADSLACRQSRKPLKLRTI